MSLTLTQVLDGNFWDQLSPLDFGLKTIPSPSRTAAELALLKQQLLREGYCPLRGQLYPDVAQRLAATTTRLVQVGIPPVFAMVYPRFWHMRATLHAAVREMIETPLQLPDFWVWYVEPGEHGVGWPPHRDRPQTLTPEGPTAITAWVALTEATPDNGCMYTLPMQHDALLKDAQARGKPADARLPLLSGPELQCIRALPAEAGDAFLWNQAVYHWGARSSQHAASPRVSVAFEFQRADVEPLNVPLLDPAETPPFPRRLSLIGKQLLQYRHMHPLTPELERLARSLAAVIG